MRKPCLADRISTRGDERKITSDRDLRAVVIEKLQTVVVDMWAIVRSEQHYYWSRKLTPFYI